MEVDFSQFGDVVNAPATVAAGVVNPTKLGKPPSRGETGDRVTEVQQALADRGIQTVGEVDGAFGLNTERAIQEFQEQVNLPRTGVLDDTTYKALTQAPLQFDEGGEATVGTLDFTQFGEVQDTPTSSNLLDFIGKGEGGYDSANRGTISGDIVGSQMVAERNGKRVSSMTIGEIRELQKITDPNNPNRLFAVGKYQTIPDTLATAVEGLGLSDDTVFTPEVQEQIGLYLVSEKRPQVGRFIRGEEGVSEDDAMLALAREFASIPVPRAVKKGEFGSWPKRDLNAGDSFYADPDASKGNKPQHTVEETRAILQQARQGG